MTDPRHARSPFQCWNCQRILKENMSCCAAMITYITLIEELQTALEEMGCSELLDCEQPQTRGSKHAENCDWEIAMKALIHSRAILGETK